MQQSLSVIRQLLQQKIFRHPSLLQYNTYSQAVFNRLHKCHTVAIGVHQFNCNNSSCNHIHYQYHSCGNRHCPNCGGMKREQWLSDRMSELLPTTYYHLVFTLPTELHALIMGNRKPLLGLLFDASHHTINTLAKDAQWLGAKPGIVSVLHTWGQQLSFHPHVHCIVSGGGIDCSGHWVHEKRKSGNYLFPKPAMQKIFKGYFLDHLKKLIAKKQVAIKEEQLIEQAIKLAGYKKWNVYAKAPFGGPAQVMEYLGRYTHKVAITPHRILHIGNDTISFKYKDYTDGNKQKELCLSHVEFIRRYEQHILPKRFVKIRHAGYLSHQGKHERIAAIHKQLQLPAPMPKVKISIQLQVLQRTGTDISLCPKCKTGTLVLVASFIMHNGQLKDIGTLKNKGSPIKIETVS